MKNIYITYPNNKIRENEQTKGWIETFLESLQIALPRVLEIKPKYLIKGTDFADDQFIDSLKTADIFVVIIDKGFDEDEQFQKELAEIGNILGLNEENSIEGITKLFKIIRYPIKEDFLSPAMNSVLGYKFYERNIYNRKIKQFVFEAEYLENTWNKVLDIAYDIAETINSSEGGSNRSRKYIFLSETTSDQVNSRDEIKRELQHFGFRVLPMTYFPEQAEELEELIIANLKRSHFCVQIMGLQYGAMVKNAKYSLPDFQNRIISKYQKENPEKNFYRLIWIPSGMKINDQRQSLYLKRLMRDEAGDNTEIIEAPSENFKSILGERLQVDTNVKRDTEARSKVYLLSEETEKEKLDRYIDLIKKNNLDPITLDFSEQKDLYSTHLKNIVDADAVLIFARNSNSYWIRSKIRDLIKAPGLGKKSPYKSIGIISDTNFQVKDLEYLSTPIDYISYDSNDLLLDFIFKAKN